MNEEEQLNSELSDHERARSAWFGLHIDLWAVGISLVLAILVKLGLTVP
jgi:hypothetical protein